MNVGRKIGMAVGALAWLAAGCATGPDFRPPPAPESADWGAAATGAPTAEARGPGGAAQRFDAAFEAPADWWTLFGSAALDAAVAEALGKSPTLEQALARLRQAREAYNAQAGSARYPAVDASLGAARQKVNPAAMGMENVPAPDPFALYQASFSVSYAFDLFGQDRRTLEALKAQVDRREIEWEGAWRTLAANVVLAAIRLAEIDQRIAAAAEIVAAREEQWEIARKRREAGGISARELESAGYLTRRQLRGKNGRITDTEYTIFEKPVKPQPEPAPPDTASPGTENPDMVNPDMETPDMAVPDTENPPQCWCRLSSKAWERTGILCAECRSQWRTISMRRFRTCGRLAAWLRRRKPTGHRQNTQSRRARKGEQHDRPRYAGLALVATRSLQTLGSRSSDGCAG